MPTTQSIPPSFTTEKSAILASLSAPPSTYTDLSPKGTVDEAIKPVDRPNKCTNWRGHDQLMRWESQCVPRGKQEQKASGHRSISSKGARSGSSLLLPCTAPRELPSAQAPLTPARLKAAAAHLRG